ncbi:MAG: hypothetical protein ITG00_01060, partial [Flavobacterium sp.]|nr:hypothetical protein [Flavobacterium sp.]
MKYFLITTLLLLMCGAGYAQKKCEYTANVKDSIGVYKETPEYLVYERNFGGLESYIFLSLAQTDGMPSLSVQLVDKSTDFIKAKCLDKNSRLFLQLENGKIATLIHVDQDNCGTTVRDDKGINNRVMNGAFLFVQGSIEDLKSSPVSIMRIRYATDTIDYILKTDLISELDGKSYRPGRYFV